MIGDGLGRCGTDAIRVRAWRGQTHVAHLTPTTPSGRLTTSDVHQTLARLAETAVTEVITAAVGPEDAAVFRQAAFAERETLHLLSHDLEELPDVELPSGYRARRVGRRELDAVLAVDHAAFHGFWRLDRAGLLDAVNATPHVRMRVAQFGDSPTPVAYGVTGRAGQLGFLQRLAVHPEHNGCGLGAAIAADGLRWLRRRRVRQAFVNTQVTNERALDLYRRLGYRSEPNGLVVLERHIRNTSPTPEETTGISTP